MGSKGPLVTVVTVSYNSEKHIKDTIESVLDQTYENIEYVIVDGNSSDNTINIVKSYEGKFRGKMRWISENDNGIYDAMNKGIDLVKDEHSYVVFLNSDDYFDTKDSIKNMIAKSNGEDFIYGMLKLVDKDYNQLLGTEIDLNALAYSKICYHPTVFVKKSVFLKVGYFSVKFKIASDYDFFVRVFLDSSTSKRFIPVTVTSMRVGGVSSTDVKKSLVEKQQIIRKYYPLSTYIKSSFYINLYELPRNKTRLVMDKYGYLNIWRDVRSHAKRIISGNTNNRS